MFYSFTTLPRSVRHLSRALLLFAVGLAACATTPQAGPAPPPPRSEPVVEPVPAAHAPPRVEIPNARTPEPGIVTGGVPSQANLEEAKRLGYRTVVSLLPEAESREEATAAAALGLDFVSIPVAGEADVTEDNARKLGEVLALPSKRPLILHCSSGNRAGALLALHAFYVDGKSPEQALALGDAAGLTKLRPAVEAKLREAR